MLRRVLVVDDSELLHSLYRYFLKKYAGCTVFCVKNGREAHEFLAREEPVDLVLLDINMPVMNGIQLLELLRDENRLADLPVIVVSTEGSDEDTRLGLSLGARAYLVKPFNATGLQQTIAAVLPEPRRCPEIVTSKPGG